MRGRAMHNAKIIRIDENVFKGRTKEPKLFDRRVSNKSTINKATIIRTDDDDVYVYKLMKAY